MKNKILHLINNGLIFLNLKIIDEKSNYKDFDKRFNKIYSFCKKETMTSIERMNSLYEAVKYIEKNNIPGDIVECGVWRGGSSMLVAKTLKSLNSENRSIYLYDTFSGMSEPTENDFKEGLNKKDVFNMWKKSQSNSYNDWCYAPISVVKNNLFKTKYNKDKLVFIKGKVEETIPKKIPKKISILRLDTDWYESTYHELTHLFPLLVKGGVLIIDDFGSWQGAKKAVLDYFEENNIKIFLNRIDYTGRIGIKN